MSFLAALNAKTMELRTARDPLAGSFQSVQALATANAKERALKAGQDLSTVKADDEDALKAINKAIKQVRDTLSLAPNDEKSLNELAILESLLPKMASEDEISEAVNMMVGAIASGEKSMKHMGPIMAKLNEIFGAGLDKAKASAIVKQALAA